MDIGILYKYEVFSPTPSNHSGYKKLIYVRRLFLFLTVDDSLH